MENITHALEMMGQGMLGIFVVLAWWGVSGRF